MEVGRGGGVWAAAENKGEGIWERAGVCGGEGGGMWGEGGGM